MPKLKTLKQKQKQKTRSRTCKNTKYTMKGSSNIKNKAKKIKYTTRNKQEK